MAYFRAAAFVLALTLVLIFAVPVQWLARRLDWRLQHAIQMRFCRVFCAIIGIRVETQGALAGDSPRFVVANHVSWTDIIALASLYPLVFLAKSEVAGWPVLGFLARLQGTVFVERGDRRAIPRVNAALAGVLRQGRDLVVFAEGTSSDGAGVLKFNTSHFAMLSEPRSNESRPVKFSIAPVAIVYTDHASRPIDVGWYGDMTFAPHLWRLMKRGGARCHLLFGDEIAPGLGDRKTLAAATESSVRELLAGAMAGDDKRSPPHAARRSLSAPPPRCSI